MAEQAVQSDDMTLKRVFQDFYRVPDYQREYVWGEADPKGERGDEVEQFLKDIYQEFESATKEVAPEYFIGTIVVCPASDEVYDLIDGQQRTTTAFLALCAIRDLLEERREQPPADLPNQIAASNTDWQGQTTRRIKLDLQYEDSRGVLDHYARGDWANAPIEGTRSIANIAGAYRAIREFLTTQLKDDSAALRRFYGYFTNKVKLIRIQTASVAKALKIFETINDRGVGLDAMDLLKNLLFMNASPKDFAALKDTWRKVTDAIYNAHEKPLRFLRYFLFASYQVDAQLQEDAIYDWFLKNETKTRHASDPIGFATRLLDAAKAYASFVKGFNPAGQPEPGIANTRYLGGSAVRQHYILLLAGRHLKSDLLGKLSREVENLMFVYLISNTPTKDYERSIIEGAEKLRALASDDEFERFRENFFSEAKKQLARRFDAALLTIHKGDMRGFRMRYLLAKLTQHIDVKAYGSTGGHGSLANYIDGKNDIEHILPENPSAEALAEFGESDLSAEVPQALGNLVLLEKTINQLLGNKPYSKKVGVYPNSQFLLVKCQASRPTFGVADQISRVVATVPSFPLWTRQTIEDRQKFLAKLAHEVWGMPA
jgi:hypothetical protein